MSFAPISAQPYGVLEAGRKRPLSYDHHEGHMREAGGGGGGGGYPFHSAPVGMEMGYRYGSQQNPPGRMMPTGMEQGSARTSGMMGAAAGELWEGGGAHAGMMRGGEGGGGGGFRPARVEGGESSSIVHLPPGTKHNAYGEGRAAKMARVGGEEELEGLEGKESETLSFLVGPDGVRLSLSLFLCLCLFLFFPLLFLFFGVSVSVSVSRCLCLCLCLEFLSLALSLLSFLRLWCVFFLFFLSFVCVYF